MPFIKHYLFLESKEPGTHTFRLFPDGHTGLVFALKTTTLYTTAQRLPAAFVYGQISRYKDLHAAGKTVIVVVVFQPAGITLLTHLPATYLCDSIVPASNLFGNGILSLQDQLNATAFGALQCSLLNNFFCRLIAGRPFPVPSLANTCLQYIHEQRGLIAVQSLAIKTGYTERHIERKFVTAIGLSPKKFAGIVRLHAFLKQLRAGAPGASLTSLAYETGYADQSHLIKEFRKYTGLTPTTYAGNTRKAAINFVAV